MLSLAMIATNYSYSLAGFVFIAANVWLELIVTADNGSMLCFCRACSTVTYKGEVSLNLLKARLFIFIHLFTYGKW